MRTFEFKDGKSNKFWYIELKGTCVLWVELGDPSEYHCGSAQRKAMGQNLAELSSGKRQGKLKISKRGSSKSLGCRRQATRTRRNSPRIAAVFQNLINPKS